MTSLGHCGNPLQLCSVNGWEWARESGEELVKNTIQLENSMTPDQNMGKQLQDLVLIKNFNIDLKHGS